jgi:hypothetical protein
MKSLFTRKELVELRNRAHQESLVYGLNPSWATAYAMIATAADYLDAMIARSTVEAKQFPDADAPNYDEEFRKVPHTCYPSEKLGNNMCGCHGEITDKEMD